MSVHENHIKFHKGTTTVGIVCKDGLVLGADTRVTSGLYIAHKRGKKIFIITPQVVLSIAGVLADAQALIDILRFNIRIHEFKSNRKVTAKEAARLLSFIMFQNRLFPLYAEILIGGLNGDGNFALYRLDPLGSLVEDKYASTGSGSPIAYGVLESEYKPDISVEEGKELVIKALISAMKRDIGSGNDIDVIIVTKEGAYEMSKEEKEKYIKEFRSEISG